MTAPPQRRVRALAALVALTAVVAVGRQALPGIRRVARSWPGRIAVEGRSMAPGLMPGDWLLVEPPRSDRPQGGDLVVLRDPRQPDRLLVKRVSRVDADGCLLVFGDAPDASTDSRTFGPVAASAIVGRPWFRYWPPDRFGRVR